MCVKNQSIKSFYTASYRAYWEHSKATNYNYKKGATGQPINTKLSTQAAVDFHGIASMIFSGFQRKVLFLLAEIRDSVRHTGKVTVEQNKGLKIQQSSTLAQFTEFESLLEEGDNLEKLVWKRKIDVDLLLDFIPRTKRSIKRSLVSLS